ncbi:MAG: UDP-N-acetyl glucosamine 2-epimerase [Thermodesulfobacteriota bacterium]|nr:UDP-N-acetyl glucosamine 2-epimerase [Thermodesulfobacteriota bacterium]
MKIISIVGARPNFIKLAPIIKAFTVTDHLIIHTGQHYDYLMSKVFFDELGIPEPDYHLDVGSGLHGWQTGEMIKKVEEILIKEKPDWVLVYGDINSTLAGALAAAKLHIPIAHIEAGLRSYNKKMAEEINRVITDHISSILFCPTENAVRNLHLEGFSNIINDGKLINDAPCPVNSHPGSQADTYNASTVINVGDIMYDSLLMCLGIAEDKSNIKELLNLHSKNYYLATIHRAENTDDAEKLKDIMDALMEISREKRVIFPVHPRTKKILDSDYSSLLASCPSLVMIDPVSYYDILILEKNAFKILTDSGGMQKEAYLLGVPCITLREDTEWIETTENRRNVLTGTDKRMIVKAGLDNTSVPFPHFSLNLYGDGKAAKRIKGVLQRR